jgi:hypothetical protein
MIGRIKAKALPGVKNIRRILTCSGTRKRKRCHPLRLQYQPFEMWFGQTAAGDEK